MLISGDAESRRLLGELATALDTPIESSANVRVIRLKFADAVELVDVLRELAQDFRLPGGERETTTTTTPVAAEPAPAPEGGESQPSPDPGQIVEETETTSYEESTVGIQAYESLNAVILSGPAALTSAMASIVKELDQRRSQVLIEAIVAEISSNDEDSFGSGLTAWSSDFGALGTNFGSLILPTSFTTGTVNLLNDIATAGAASIGGDNRGIAVGVGDSKKEGDRGFAALVSLVKSQGNSRVVSTPSIMTLDNEEASIIIGDNVSVQTGTTGTGTDTRDTYERRDVGLSLKIKPQINADNIIRLRIEQELSTEPTGVGLDLQYRKRTINTSVLVGDGNIIVLGGLAERETEESSSKVPFLGDFAHRRAAVVLERISHRRHFQSGRLFAPDGHFQRGNQPRIVATTLRRDFAPRGGREHHRIARHSRRARRRRRSRRSRRIRRRAGFRIRPRAGFRIRIDAGISGRENAAAAAFRFRAPPQGPAARGRAKRARERGFRRRRRIAAGRY